MSESGNMQYLHLCVRYEPPLIGVVYKTKDDKKRVYTILLQRLVLHPNPLQAAEQLYLQHPHILKQNKIPKEKIAQLILKIQRQLNINDELSAEDGQEQYQQDQYQQDQQQQHQQQQYQQEVKKQEPKPPGKKRQFDFDKDFGKDDGPLNRSM